MQTTSNAPQPGPTPAVPLVGFLVALVVLGIVMFLLPGRARPWLALLIVLGAIVAQGGAGPVEEIRKRVFKQ